MLRETGKVDEGRLEKYLRERGSRIPRTTLRYAIERFPPGKRRTLLLETQVTNRVAIVLTPCNRQGYPARD